MQDTLYELDYHDSGRDIETLFVDLNEQIDLHSRVSDLVTYVEGITEPSMETVQVVLRAVDIALAGTPYTHKDLNVAVESESSSVSMENVKGALAAIRQSIVAAIKALLDMIKRAWQILTNNTERLAFRLKRTRSVAKTMAGRRLGAQIKLPVTAGQIYLKLNGKVVPGGTAVGHGLDQLRHQVSVILNDYLPQVDRIGNNMIAILNGNDVPASMLEALNREAIRLPVAQVASKISARSQVDSRWSLSQTVFVGPPLLGDKSLYCYAFPPTGNTPTAIANEIRTFKITFDSNKNQKPVVGEIDVLTVDMVMAILDKVEAITKLVRDNDTSSAERKMETIISTIEKAVSRLSKSDSTRAEDEAILRYATAFAGWTTSPRVALMQHAVLCCESMITLCNRSLAHYR